MNHIKKLRLEKGISQKYIADLFNIAQQTVSAYENGTREPDAKLLRCLSDYFNVSIDYLLGNTNIREKSDELLKCNSGELLECESDETQLTDEELRILELFRQLNGKEKIKIEGMLEMKVSEAKDLKRGMSSGYQNGEEAATLVKDLA